MNYSKALRIARAAKNIDQQSLANKAKLSKSLISKIEAQHRELSTKVKKKILRALDMPPKLFEILALESDKVSISNEQLKEVAKHLLEINTDIDKLNEQK